MAEFESAAATMGARVHPDLPPEVATAIRSLPGIAARDQNFFPRVIETDDSLVFDWVWRDDRLKDRKREAQTVFAFRVSSGSLPAFLLARRGEIEDSEIRSAGGAVPFSTPAIWNDRNVVVGRSRSAIRKVFPTALREIYEVPARVRVEGSGAWLVVYRPGRLANPGTFEMEREDARRLLDPWLSSGEGG